MTRAIFEASPEGFRQLNLARPPAHVIREAIQNVFDEAASQCDVLVKWTPAAGVTLIVTDDVPGGIRDERLIFTIWMSDKQDSPNKRGRMGRGLKELVSVSSKTIVATAGRPATIFKRTSAGTWSRSSSEGISVPTGTKIEATVHEWPKAALGNILAYLRQINPPAGLRYTVNGEVVHSRKVLETYNLCLSTLMYENGKEKEISKSCEVSLFAETTPYVYEMGLPIEPIDYPLSIDVGQRVPLREKRDTLLESYRKELLAKLLNVRIGHLAPEQLRDNHVLIAAAYHFYLTDEVKYKLAEVWTEGRPYASTPQQVAAATNSHVRIVNLRTLPEAIRDIVRNKGISVQTIFEKQSSELCPQVDPSITERNLVDAWTAIAAGIGRPASVIIRDGTPTAIASFGDTVISVYRRNIPNWEDWCRNPYTPEPLSILIHELAHWKRLEDAHGFEFHSDAEEVGARIAYFLYTYSIPGTVTSTIRGAAASKPEGTNQ